MNEQVKELYIYMLKYNAYVTDFKIINGKMGGNISFQEYPSIQTITIDVKLSDE